MANGPESLQESIRAAFPDVAFSGEITSADGQISEELDEEQALYGALHGRRWSDIPEEFIEQYPDGLALLGDAAFAAFLPSWLVCTLHNATVREMIVYFFSPDEARSPRMASRIQQLSRPQRDVLRSVMARCLELESSKYVKEHARKALAYVESLAE